MNRPYVLLRHVLLLCALLVLTGCDIIDKFTSNDEKPRPKNSAVVEPVKPIDEKELAALLPQVEGWKREEPQAVKRMIGGQPVTAASARYTLARPPEKEAKPENEAKPEKEGENPTEGEGENKADSTGEPPTDPDQPTATEEELPHFILEILDGAYVPGAYASLAVMAHSQEGGLSQHKFGVDIRGHKGIEDWDTKTAGVTLVLVVERRFRVTLQGTKVPAGLTREIVGAADLEKLASWASKK